MPLECDFVIIHKGVPRSDPGLCLVYQILSFTAHQGRNLRMPKALPKHIQLPGARPIAEGLLATSFDFDIPGRPRVRREWKMGVLQ